MQLSDRLAGQTLNLFKGFTVLLRYHHLKQVNSRSQSYCHCCSIINIVPIAEISKINFKKQTCASLMTRIIQAQELSHFYEHSTDKT